ncbi:MAG: hypothetical protein EOP09_03930, partial [Proteobacteria bacterium]
LEEEVRELKEALIDKHSLAELEGEIADVLFCTVNIAHLSKIDADTALRNGLAKFQRRFNHVESGILSQGKRLEDSTLAEMDQFWDEAKQLERSIRLKTDLKTDLNSESPTESSTQPSTQPLTQLLIQSSKK